MQDFTLRAALLVAAGAAAGAVARWALGVALPRGFPYATATVNVAGSFLLGLLVFGGWSKGWLGDDARLLLGVGLLGAFTTMSAFAVDTLAMLERGDTGRALVNLVVNPLLSVVAAWFGWLAAHAVPPAPA